MRYMTWIAIISLQMSMFVCGAGIDVCHAADAPAHIETTQSNNNSSDAAPVDSTCFLGSVLNVKFLELTSSLNIHAVHRIEA